MITDIQKLRIEFHKILNDEDAAGRALDAVIFATASTTGTLEPIASAYKIYLAGGGAPYSREDLANAVATHKEAESVGLQSSLIDILHHGV
jgi:hypothetical protein